MPFCPAVCCYRVQFSDGTVLYPKLPGSVNVSALAEQYAVGTLSKNGKMVYVVSIERQY